jgi:hypothetical protein
MQSILITAPPLATFGDRVHGSAPACLSPEEARVDDQYIQRENIALFRKRLLETSDLAARRVLLTLLAEEEAKAIRSHLVGPRAGSGVS